MTGPKGIVLGLLPPQELGDAPLLAELIEVGAPAGQHLVGVSLVTDVEHQPIPGRVERVVDAGDELDGAEARCQVAARLRHALDDLGADLVRHLGEHVPGESPQVLGRVDPLQQLPLGHRSLRTA